MKVRQVTPEQRDALAGQEFAPDSHFSPTEDADGNWFISNEEIEQNTNADFDWVKDLPEIQHNPKRLPFP